MPKQTKSTPVSESIVAAAVPAAPVESSSSSAPVRKSRSKKIKDIAAEAAAQHILLHAKRPSTDYLYFCEEVRPQIQREHPEFNFTQVGQEQGRRWKALPTEVRAMYKARWEADKKRYDEEKAQVELARQQNPEIFKALDAQKKKQSRRGRKSGIKRARSAFIIFCQEQRPVVKSGNPTLSFTETGRLLGQQWKAMSDEQKSKYVEQAREDQERYYGEKKAQQEAEPAPAEQPAKKPRKPAEAAAPAAEAKKPRKPKATEPKAEKPVEAAAPATAEPAAEAKKPRKPKATEPVAAAAPAADAPKKRGPKPKSADAKAQ
jgi:hypothetical protein